MPSRFAGGPFDGREFTDEQLNAVAVVHTISSESGDRQFLFMPAPAACDRILCVELSKEQAEGPFHIYERVVLPSGVEEYRVAASGAFESAMKPQSEPLSAEALARARLFARFADQFIEELRSAKITGATEVNILYHCVDRQGAAVEPIRRSITLAESVGVDENLRLDNLISRVNWLVRNAPTGFVFFSERPETELQIRWFDLEIAQP
jgi:hypothetical protein